MSKMDHRDLIQSTHDTTNCPYDNEIKIIQSTADSMKRKQQNEQSMQYFYDAKQIEQMSKSNKKHCGNRDNKDGEKGLFLK